MIRRETFCHQRHLANFCLGKIAHEQERHYDPAGVDSDLQGGDERRLMEKVGNSCGEEDDDQIERVTNHVIRYNRVYCRRHRTAARERDRFGIQFLLFRYFRICRMIASVLSQWMQMLGKASQHRQRLET